MITELSIYDIEAKDQEIKNIVDQVSKFNLSYISVFPYYVKNTKRLLENTKIKLSCPIDFPLGISDTKNRQQELLLAIKNGAQKIEMVFPSLLVINRKYDKLREEIKTNLAICKEAGVELNYFLEYRHFDHVVLAKVAEILMVIGVNVIYPSTGFLIDDINDNLIACSYFFKKTAIKSITNGNIWQESQVKNIIKSEVYGVRFSNLNSLQLFYEKSSSEI